MGIQTVLNQNKFQQQQKKRAATSVNNIGPDVFNAMNKRTVSLVGHLKKKISQAKRTEQVKAAYSLFMKNVRLGYVQKEKAINKLRAQKTDFSRHVEGKVSPVDMRDVEFYINKSPIYPLLKYVEAYIGQLEKIDKYQTNYNVNSDDLKIIGMNKESSDLLRQITSFNITLEQISK